MCSCTTSRSAGVSTRDSCIGACAGGAAFRSAPGSTGSRSGAHRATSRSATTSALLAPPSPGWTRSGGTPVWRNDHAQAPIAANAVHNPTATTRRMRLPLDDTDRWWHTTSHRPSRPGPPCSGSCVQRHRQDSRSSVLRTARAASLSGRTTLPSWRDHRTPAPRSSSGADVPPSYHPAPLTPAATRARSGSARRGCCRRSCAGSRS
jgi:hypothetical protein